VIRYFQERMPYGLFVPDVDVAWSRRGRELAEHEATREAAMAAFAKSWRRE
jgi:hypothetical protein